MIIEHGRLAGVLAKHRETIQSEVLKQCAEISNTEKQYEIKYV